MEWMIYIILYLSCGSFLLWGYLSVRDIGRDHPIWAQIVGFSLVVVFFPLFLFWKLGQLLEEI